MSIEVRQLSIRCQLAPSTAAAPASAPPTPWELQALREQLLAECKAWLQERLQQARER
jgi:hypothetical protein